MKLMADSELTEKVMSKLGNPPSPSDAQRVAPGPSVDPNEEPEINNLRDAAKQVAIKPVFQVLVASVQSHELI